MRPLKCEFEEQLPIRKKKKNWEEEEKDIGRI